MFLELLTLLGFTICILLLGALGIFGLDLLVSFFREDVLGQEPVEKRIVGWHKKK